MKIGVLAKETGTEVETLRYYERIGLLAPPLRQANGYRSYPEQAVQQVRFIRHCRDLGISLGEIERILTLSRQPEADCDEIDRILADHVAQVRTRMQALQMLEQQLLALQGQCGASKRTADCGILRELVAAADAAHCACHG
jgi:DNA-binding transcriptional MerR regulator